MATEDGRDLYKTDKFYWHRFQDAYREHVERLTDPAIVLEFGVFKGESIRWLSGLFPNARIIGLDILPLQPIWPTGAGIEYFQVDQGDCSAIRSVMDVIGTELDLVIEDGSHHPRHQRNCLVEVVPRIRRGGIYVLEDLHTSAAELRDHGLIREGPIHFSDTKHLAARAVRRGQGMILAARRGRVNRSGFANSLSVLWAIERSRSRGEELSGRSIEQLASGPYFTKHDVESLDRSIESVAIYQRSTLPLECHACRGADFDLSVMECVCGVPLLTNDDSMTAVLTMRS